MRGEIDIDRAVYERAGRDPNGPILYAGNLQANVAFFGRDLGRDEVLNGEPLIGGAGRRVRRAAYAHFIESPASSGDADLKAALEFILLTNTVPFKPKENKAFPNSVRERFRPYIARFLVSHWHGNCIITLGNEAFSWFAPYAEPGACDAFWKREDRYSASLNCRLTSEFNAVKSDKKITVMPLPHPSPLNTRYWDQFPALIDHRLSSL